MKFITFLIAAVMTAQVYAQRIISPEVSKDGRVTFRFSDPNAKDVQVRLETKGNLPMQKDGNGIWTVTTDPMDPDIYTYRFAVDGMTIIDPNNPDIKYNLLNIDSQVHVPGPSTLPWEINDVPHGQVHHHYYKSGIIGDNRDFYVYTPPMYNASSKQEYPVLYLLHGYSDDASAWVNVGRANYIMDNLIAQGKVKPIILVMPLGYGDWNLISNGWQRVRDTSAWNNSFRKFRESIFKELIPMVEKDYKVQKNANSRAIAGLSMGGSQSLIFGLNNPDKFAWIGAFSSGGLGDFNQNFSNVSQTINSKLHLLWIACGKQDGLIENNRQFTDWLKNKNIRYTWTESEGAHSFIVWRRYLSEFTPLLFR